MLARPHPPKIETVNDINCGLHNFWRATDPKIGDSEAVVSEIINDLDPYLINVWRSIQGNPEETAEWANQPVHELSLHATHRWLVLGEGALEFREKLRNDPHYFDPKRAGWWIAGICMWIGGGWCSVPTGAKGERIWTNTQNVPAISSKGKKINSKGLEIHNSRQIPKVSEGRKYGGTGVHSDHGSNLHKKHPRLAARSDDGTGVHRSKQVPHIGDISGKGVHSSQGRPQLADAYARGRGVHSNDSIGTCEQRRQWLINWFSALRDRLRTVRVCCGDFMRVMESESVTTRLGTTSIFADPPYPHTNADGKASRDSKLYSSEGDPDDIRDRLLAYCLERGNDKRMRIVVSGYDTDGYAELEKHGWGVIKWKADGGYANKKKKHGLENVNANRERLWFSPHCIKEKEEGFDF